MYILATCPVQPLKTPIAPNVKSLSSKEKDLRYSKMKLLQVDANIVSIRYPENGNNIM